MNYNSLEAAPGGRKDRGAPRKEIIQTTTEKGIHFTDSGKMFRVAKITNCTASVYVWTSSTANPTAVWKELASLGSNALQGKEPPQALFVHGATAGMAFPGCFTTQQQLTEQEAEAAIRRGTF